MTRRDYGSGSIYQRCEPRYGCPPRVDGQRPAHRCAARWYGVLEVGWTAEGRRDRITVSGRTKSEVQRRLREKRRQVDAGESVAGARVTVKQWAETYLELRKADLRPKAWNAAASPIRRWVVPTIGHKRLEALTPADVRAVADAQFAAGRKAATAHATQRALTTMLNHAIREGHSVPQRVLMVPKPTGGKSDRTDLSLDETVRCLRVAASLPDGIRWALALLYGVRQGEALGLTRDCLDFGAKVIRLEWQLQPLPYLDRADKAKGFRVPRDHEARHLVDAYHLVRPKSRDGVRVLAMIPPIEEALHAWLAACPENPWGLVFPTDAGRPRNDKTDRSEWWEIQERAGVHHPTRTRRGPDGAVLPGWYHVHECRNFAATSLDEVDAGENVITSILGHASIVTSRGYMRAHVDAKRRATAAVGDRLGGVLEELAP